MSLDLRKQDSLPQGQETCSGEAVSGARDSVQSL